MPKCAVASCAVRRRASVDNAIATTSICAGLDVKCGYDCRCFAWSSGARLMELLLLLSRRGKELVKKKRGGGDPSHHRQARRSIYRRSIYLSSHLRISLACSFPQPPTSQSVAPSSRGRPVHISLGNRVALKLSDEWEAAEASQLSKFTVCSWSFVQTAPPIWERFEYLPSPTPVQTSGKSSDPACLAPAKLLKLAQNALG